MDIGTILQNRLSGKTMQVLKNVLDYRAANHSVISGNLANIETPGYEPQKVTFDRALKDAVVQGRTVPGATVALQRTHEMHLPLAAQKSRAYTVGPMESAGVGEEKLNIDREMARMAQNNLLFEASVQLLSRKFEALKTAIRGRI